MKLYIFGGRPCSGKTTFAHQLGKETGYNVLYLDVFAHEMVMVSTKESPELYKWKTIPMIDILQTKPSVLFQEYLTFYEELFPNLLTMLRNRDDACLILESALLLPKYIIELKKYFEVEVVYLKTSDDFVKKTYPKRDYAQEMLKSPFGKIALNNLLERDVLFSEYLYKEANKLKMPVFSIEEGQFENRFEEIKNVFDLKM